MASLACHHSAAATTHHSSASSPRFIATSTSLGLRSLIAQITTTVAEASNLSKRNVWVYITDLVPRQMVEFGHVLPEAGDEARWAAALPEADRAHMERFALTH
jgi:phenylpyruvate tautomerase PptA (4-oxalocrotonate tautomerase family)